MTRKSKITNTQEFYGLISGSTSASFADGVNKHLENSLIISTWEDIPAFQKAVGKDSRESLKGMTAILITDYAFDKSMGTQEKVFAFHFMQSMFLQKELYGVHLVLFSKDVNLIDALNEHYLRDPDSKYEGSRFVLSTSDYTITAVKNVLNTPFSLLSFDDKILRERQIMLEKARDEENRRISARGFLSLLGKQEALQEMLEITQRELTVVNRKILEYATAINDSNLDTIVDELTTQEQDIKDLFYKL